MLKLTLLIVTLFLMFWYLGESGGVSQEAGDNRNLSDSFTPFVNDGNHLSSGVRVVHVQTVPDGTNSNSSGQVNTSSGTILMRTFPKILEKYSMFTF